MVLSNFFLNLFSYFPMFYFKFIFAALKRTNGVNRNYQNALEFSYKRDIGDNCSYKNDNKEEKKTMASIVPMP